MLFNTTIYILRGLKPEGTAFLFHLRPVTLNVSGKFSSAHRLIKTGSRRSQYARTPAINPVFAVKLQIAEKLRFTQ